jgi:hypothetical protein
MLSFFWFPVFLINIASQNVMTGHQVCHTSNLSGLCYRSVNFEIDSCLCSLYTGYCLNFLYSWEFTVGKRLDSLFGKAVLKIYFNYSFLKLTNPWWWSKQLQFVRKTDYIDCCCSRNYLNTYKLRTGHRLLVCMYPS